MSVETILETALTGVTGTAVWGSRVYPSHTPDSVTFPAVAYAVISSELIASGGTYASQTIIDCYAHSYAETREMRDAVLTIADDNEWIARPGQDEYEKDSGLYHVAIELEIVHYLGD